MTATSEPGVFVGFDLGTTTFKALAVDGRGRELAVARVSSPWSQRGGLSVLTGDAVLAAVGRLAGDLSAATRGRPVRAASFASIAEAGFLVAPASGRTESAALIWHDANGTREASELRTELGDDFEGRTGVGLTERISAAKARWLRHRDGVSHDQIWLGVADWVAWQLGGRQAAELSLAARTGLLDLATRTWWPEAVALAGLALPAMPPLAGAGHPLGRADDRIAPLAGAMLSVSGHDHLAAAVGAGSTGTDVVSDSLGTGEAVTRPTGRGDSPARVAASVRSGLARGPHVLPGLDYAFAALGSGRVLAAVRDLVFTDAGGWAALCERAGELDPGAAAPLLAELFDGTTVNSDAVRRSDPALAWRAAIEHTTNRCQAALAAIDELAGPYDRVQAAGGWLRIPVVREIRTRRIPHYRICPSSETGALGAATVAAWSVGHLPPGSVGWRDSDSSSADSSSADSSSASPGNDGLADTGLAYRHKPSSVSRREPR